jgi:hypothetical protein
MTTLANKDTAKIAAVKSFIVQPRGATTFNNYAHHDDTPNNGFCMNYSKNDSQHKL